MKSSLVVALLAALAATFVHPAHAQPLRNREDLTEVRQLLQRAPEKPSMADTAWIGHVTSGGQLPFRVGRGPRRPGLSPGGLWDFDQLDGGALDSMQGWVPIVRPNDRTAGTIPDYQRPWMALDYGNRMNAGPVQGRTIGIVSAWHVDRGSSVPDAVTPGASPTWTPLSGTASAWCGLRAGDDLAYLDAVVRGGTGNPINGEALQGLASDGLNPTAKNFPGYGDQWDQMLYRDVRVANGGALTVSFRYQTRMSTSLDNSASRCTGWFDKDPLNLQQGGSGPGAHNFISATAHSPLGAGPIDSFMVYVGVPANPTSCQYSDGLARRPVFDLKRRWFSEVIAIDKPYKEILSTFGANASTWFTTASDPSIALTNSVIQPMLDAQGAADGGGVIRLVFRVKTNKDFSDETGTGGAFGSGTRGAAHVDDVAISGCTPAFTTSGFESDGEINNSIEASNSVPPGPAVGQGYALGAWHATGKPPKLMAHTHPVDGGLIGPGNDYALLAWADMCGTTDSPLRQCNLASLVVSTGDHDRDEAAGGAPGTPFQETRQGLMSPTINLVTPTEGVNSCGLTRANVSTTDDWLLTYDIYPGIFGALYSGNVWQWGAFSYPATQANGAKVWGDLCLPTYALSSTDRVCVQDYARLKSDGLIHTSNPGGIPDSIRLYLGREQRCISWGVTTYCSPTDGHYLDDISLGFPPDKPGATSLGTISADLGQWINDTFPFSEDPSLPGTAAFDTCAALLKTGMNIAPTTGNTLRFDVPGDTTVVLAEGDGIRVDLVFRILPGPGNYVIAGNRASGLRKVPASAVAAAPGDGSFWGDYLADPGAFSKGTHSGGWNPDTWNSARCDTAELNLFPVDGRQGNLGGLGLGRWAGTYHESDPRFGTLGILKHRCFLSDTLPSRPIDHSNITCNSVPGWLTALPPGRTGYDGNPQTREFTKIIPDGLLTPGSHVEYFFRKSRVADPSAFAMVPDTEYIAPQPDEGPNYDGHRWQQFGVLPDRWKATEYGGIGGACTFYLDAADGRGAERVWVGMADSIGATRFDRYGAHNGWHAEGSYLAPDGTHDFMNQRVGGDPTIAVWKHGGQPGSSWDMYGVKGAGTFTGPAGSLGGRLANRSGMGLMAGRESRQGPTALMLRTYYRLVCLSTGDLAFGVLGPVANSSQNDIALLQDFLTVGADPDHPRGIWAMGHGFVEGNDWIDAAHNGFLSDNLAVSLKDPSYFAMSGAMERFPDLIPTSVVSGREMVYSVGSSCLLSNDVLEVNTLVSGATPGSHYENLGGQGPYVSGAYAPSTPGHPYVSLVDGWYAGNMFSRGGGSSVGRLSYFLDVLVNVFGSVCAFPSAPCVEVEPGWDCPGAVPEDSLAPPLDFVALRNNPLVSGVTTLQLGLARPDRVEARVYDLAGRRVRVLADREFLAGQHRLAWDGTDDHGQRLARGVYFTTVRYVRGGFHAERKLTILR